MLKYKRICAFAAIFLRVVSHS